MEKCPTCGELFETTAGMKRHHALAHGESIAGIEIDCDVCGDTVTKRPHQVKDHEYNVCSKSCRIELLSEQSSGESNPNYKGGKSEYQCENCEEPVYMWESVAKQSSRHFCSIECRKEWQSKYFSGENSPHWSKKTVKCSECGKQIQRFNNETKAREHLFCSSDCKNKFHSKQMSGSNNPNWQHGQSDTHIYGPEWDSIRKCVLERDEYECSICGLSNDAHRRSYRGELEIHHIRPIAEFTSHEQANQTENLISLCSRCHGKVEHGGKELRDKLAMVARSRSGD